MENIYKEVDFETYCETCEHKDLKKILILAMTVWGAYECKLGKTCLLEGG